MKNYSGHLEHICKRMLLSLTHHICVYKRNVGMDKGECVCFGDSLIL